MIAPERMRQIRLARGYTLDELANRMGGIVTKMALSQYENGKAQPRPVVLLQMARALSVKQLDLSVVAPMKVAFLGYRRSSGMTKTMAQGLESRIAFDLEKRVRLQQLVQLGTNSSFRFDPIQVSTIEEAEDAALTVRDRMGIGLDAIGNVTETLERHGLHVFALENAPEKFHGISALVQKADEVISAGIVDRAGVCGERQRLTRAHEAGHVFTTVTDELDAEKVAYRFAGAFLIPAETLREEVGSKRKTVTMEELLTLKRRYGISVAALLKRLADQSIITPTHYEAWCKRRIREGWRLDEPEPLEPEVSSWLRQNVCRAHAEGLVTTREAEEMLGERIGGELPSLSRLRAFRQLPKEEQDRLLAQEAEELAQLYHDDMAKPSAERELTAFMLLDGVDPIHEVEEARRG